MSKNAALFISLAIGVLCVGLLLMGASLAGHVEADELRLRYLRADFSTHQQNHDVDVASLRREIEQLRAVLEARPPSVVVNQEWANRYDRHEQRIGQLEYARYGVLSEHP